MKIAQLPVQIDSETLICTHFIAFASDGHTPMGLAVLNIDGTEQCGWISRVFVSPDARRAGVGRALVNKALSHCRDEERHFASLSVKDDNTAAQSLYASLGFKPFMKGEEGYTQYLKVLRP